MRRAALAGVFLVVAATLVLGCQPRKPVKGTIKVGSKSFTEQLLLGEITRLVLEAGGYVVVDRLGLAGTMTARQALERGEIDLYWEYTGTAWIVSFGHTKPEGDGQALYERVRAEDAARGLVWLQYAPLDSSYALMLSRASASRLGISRVGELGDRLKAKSAPIRLAAGHEFYARPDGLPGLETHYGFEFERSRVKVMDPGLTYQALRDGHVDAAVGFATDGRIEAFGLVVLADDRGFFPVYNPAPVIRKEVLDRHADIGPLLARVAPKLTTEVIRKLNYAVDGRGERPERVALEWLKGEGLVRR